jgi:hypothetical protein
MHTLGNPEMESIAHTFGTSALWEELNSIGESEIDIESVLDQLDTTRSHQPSSRRDQSSHEPPGPHEAAAEGICCGPASTNQPQSSNMLISHYDAAGAATVAASNAVCTLQMQQQAQAPPDHFDVFGEAAVAAAAGPVPEWCYPLHSSDLLQQTAGKGLAAAAESGQPWQLPQVLHSSVWPAGGNLQPPRISSSMFAAAAPLAAAATTDYAASLRLQQAPMGPACVNSAPQLMLNSSMAEQSLLSLSAFRSDSASNLTAAKLALKRTHKPKKAQAVEYEVRTPELQLHAQQQQHAPQNK